METYENNTYANDKTNHSTQTVNVLFWNFQMNQ